MQITPRSDEIDSAVELLVDTYNVSTQLIGKLFGIELRDASSEILKRITSEAPNKKQFAKLLIERQGTTLFSGSEEHVVDLRFALLSKVNDSSIIDLFRRYSPNESSINSPARMRTSLSEKRWHSGKAWPQAFVTVLKFPKIFAGIVGTESPAKFEDVPPLIKPPNLVPYQENLKNEMLAVLEKEGDKTRCVVTMPTGCGKTRVAVEAFIAWMQPRFALGKYLIWIAQSEELCEQAIACIQQMWSTREFIAPLRVYRYFGGREIEDEVFCGGVVVASIQQLHTRTESKCNSIDIILHDTGAMIIDEAHRATSAMYNTFLDRAKLICGETLFPICGLTATPGRAGANQSEETQKLVGQFDAYLIKPDVPEKYASDPIAFFRDEKFLSRANHVVVESGREYTLTDEQIDDMKREGDLSSGFLKQLAADNERNIRIINKLMQIGTGGRTLVYTCSVRHAEFLAGILTHLGRRSASISSSTTPTLRRAIINTFKNQQLDFLFNFGVLTTGFDAPKTTHIVLCRPTTSAVLYEQIVGRGLRGPKFGGTEECTIIDFSDNIKRLGRPLAYTRFDSFWTSIASEE
jgi:DNA repair protein RadD